MDISFWNERWSQNQIGFHQPHINPYLAYFYGEKGQILEKRKALKVFVPLCGKSLDMLWLAQNGYAVFGVESSKKAVDDFFTENGLNVKMIEASADELGATKHNHAFYQHTEQLAPIEIYQGDIFAIQEKDLADVTDVFDRASLIALPESMRQQYVSKMAECQKSGVRTLLITLTYNQSEMNGPPFSVTEEEVHDLYNEHFTVDKLMFKNILEDEQHFKAKGLTSLIETVYKLKKK